MELERVEITGQRKQRPESGAWTAATKAGEAQRGFLTTVREMPGTEENDPKHVLLEKTESEMRIRIIG